MLLPFKVIDSSSLTDADWSLINKLNRAFEAWEKLTQDDPLRPIVILSACFPQLAAEAIKDQMAEAGKPKMISANSYASGKARCEINQRSGFTRCPIGGITGRRSALHQNFDVNLNKLWTRERAAH
jgi:hypothetical protein